MLVAKTKPVLEQETLNLLRQARLRDLQQSLFAGILGKGDATRLAGRVHLEKRQEMLENDILEEHKLKLKALNQLKDDQKKKMTDQERTADDFRKKKLRQQLHLNTQEIRDLESQLRACYVGKGVHAQMKENQLRRTKEQLRKKAHLEAQMIAWKDQEEEDRKAKEEKLRQQFAFRLTQQDHLIQQQKRKLDAYQAFVREKLMLDSIVQELLEEDRKRTLQTMIRKKAQQNEIQEYLAAQEAWKARSRKQLEEENKRIQAYIEMKSNRDLELMQGMQKKWEAQEMINDKLARKLYEEKMRAVEKEQVLQELAEEELHEAQEARLRQEFNAAVQRRIDLRLAMGHQQRERALQLQREVQEEQRLRQEMMDARARQDRLDQLTEERRRIKMQLHRQAVERLLRERRTQRNVELEQIMRDYEEQMEEERARDRIIEEERIKILQKHAQHVLGFMPRGLLRSSDVKELGSDLQCDLSQHGKAADICALSL